MNRLTEAERVLGLDVSASMPGRWYAEEVVEAIIAARLASVKADALNDAADAIQALHPGEVKNSVTFLRERAAVLGSDAHTEQKGTGE